MSKPREGCAWDESRVAQFKKLEQLVNSVSLLNHGSNFIGHVQECIELADDLRKWDMEGLNSSFMQFMIDQIIKDRFGEQQ
ncbi:MAG: hypothetical protein ACKO0Z_21960 [Betaproteobacteria bacterium]